jgi:hypothetical protein
LSSRLKNDSGKLAMAARVRQETIRPIKWIALVQASAPKANPYQLIEQSRESY